MSTPSFSNVTVDAKANVYFDGKVVSHSVHFTDGSKKTLGLIYPGEYHFGTAAAEGPVNGVPMGNSSMSR